MNDRPDHDDSADVDALLRRRLRSLPAEVSTDATERLAALRPRFGRARRRRQVATTALGTAAALVVVGVVAYAGGSDGARVDVPAGPGVTSTRPTSTTAPPTNTTEPPSTIVIVPPTSLPTPPSTPPGSVTTTRPAATTSRPSNTSPTAPDPAPAEVATPTAGGTVVVRHDATTVTLVRTEPAVGWSVAETRTEADRVEVRFRRDGSSEEAKVVARIDQGRFRVETS